MFQSKLNLLTGTVLMSFSLFFIDNMRSYMNDLYLASREYDLLAFWSRVCKDKSVKNLMLRSDKEKKKKKKRRRSSDEDVVDLTQTTADRLREMKERCRAEMEEEFDEGEEEDEDDSLFSRGVRMGTQELAGQRILQVRLQLCFHV